MNHSASESTQRLDFFICKLPFPSLSLSLSLFFFRNICKSSEFHYSEKEIIVVDTAKLRILSCFDSSSLYLGWVRVVLYGEIWREKKEEWWCEARVGR